MAAPAQYTFVCFQHSVVQLLWGVNLHPPSLPFLTVPATLYPIASLALHAAVTPVYVIIGYSARVVQSAGP